MSGTRVAPVAPVAFDVALLDGDGAHPTLRVTGADAATGARATVEHRLRGRTHDGHLDWLAALAPTFGTRVPRNRRPPEPSTCTAPFRALLTENLSPRVRHGYGDPAVRRVPAVDVGGAAGEPDWYYLVATSNDAPDAFPLARSRDLAAWELVGFVFPEGRAPAWAATGEGASDFWAPELHRVDGEYRLYFTAREREGRELAIGVATAPRPDGPFDTPAAPLLRGNVIDAHLLVADDGASYLLWKDDANGVWPERLHALLHEHPRLADALFDDDEDRRTAALVAACWPWVRAREPMERFFVQQLLVEAATDRFTAVRARLDALRAHDADLAVREAAGAVRDAMRTPIWAQPLSPDGRTLVGERTLVLENDRPWEAHLVEGVWVEPHAGRYYLFHAGNDFSTGRYGIGVAVADAPLGPYRKAPEPFLRSTAEWWGPGHPSVARGPDGGPWLFLHAFRPGRTGYNEFRALLGLPIAFDGDRVMVRA